MEPTNPQLEQGRAAYERRSWRAAHDALEAAHALEPLMLPDLWRLAVASFLVGREDDFARALQDGYLSSMDAHQPRLAARCAFWLGFHLINRGEPAQATGWFGRAARLLEEMAGDCAERGYLLLPIAFQRLGAGDVVAAARTASEAAAIGHRFGDGDLLALALHIQGRSLLRQSRVEEGLALLDEAMVAAAADELSPHVTGLIYCGVISACREVYAIRRAQEWTSALTEWCERQPDMVPYAGECRVYRAEIFQQRGEWHDAIAEARRASEHLEHGPEPRAAALATYQQAEVHRLRGEFAAAEAGYRDAGWSGREAQPGLALLRLAQGDAAAAVASLRRALAETSNAFQRARLLPAYVESLLELGEIEESRRACQELAGIAEVCGASVLDAMVAQARGSIELAAGHAAASLAPLRQAWRGWQAAAVPYDAARVRMLLGLACRELGDEDGAALELAAARTEFQRLGASPDLARLDALKRAAPYRRHGLTRRQRQVLALLATGRTNRAIADTLSISEKTVARHVANIFGKLGLSSRAAATAYAYEHDLLDPSA